MLERLIEEAHDAELLVVADAKRGDFTNTNQGYAQAWLREGSPLAVDAVTASPYLGVSALAPLFDLAAQTGRGVFVLVATSNDEGRAIQGARGPEGEPVQSMVWRAVAERNHLESGLGSFGVVFGATRETPDFDLKELAGPYLVPGVGAQGGEVKDVARLFEQCAKGTVLVNVGRSICEPDQSVVRCTTAHDAGATNCSRHSSQNRASGVV